jgi:hypothetical protein
MTLSATFGVTQRRVSMSPSTAGYSGLPRNLQSALISIRHRRQPLVIWTDAICINQDDVSERGHQVDLMKEIYSAAKLVRVCLDVHVDLGSPAFAAAPRLKLTTDWVGAHDLFGRRELRQTACLEDYNEAFWNPLCDIFANPYWKRVWTQQELFLARDLLFHFPTGTLRPQSLLAFERTIYCQNHETGSMRRVRNSILNPLFSNLQNGFRRTRHRHENCDKSSASSLLSLFLNSHKLESKDPRDRVFGLLGLTGDRKPYIKADYDLTVVQTFRLVVRQYVYNYQSLDFLCYRSRLEFESDQRPHSHSFPSWLPSPEKRLRTVPEIWYPDQGCYASNIPPIWTDCSGVVTASYPFPVYSTML